MSIVAILVGRLFGGKPERSSEQELPWGGWAP